MGDAAGRLILIVEDDADTADSVQLVLEKEGYRAITAPTAQEGLEKVRGSRPDLVLLDVMMPAGTEGFQFVWSLRQDEDPALRDTPIIVLTAIHQTTPLRLYPDQSDGTYSPNEFLPVQGFLDKPVAFDKLLSQVRQGLGGEAAPSDRG